MFLHDPLRAVAAASATVLLSGAAWSQPREAGGNWLDEDAEAIPHQSPAETAGHAPPKEERAAKVEASASGDADRDIPPPPPPRGSRNQDDEPGSVRVFEPEGQTPGSSPATSEEVTQEADIPADDDNARSYTGPPTLLGSRPLAFGGYGGVDVRWSRLGGRDALLVGGEAALLIDHRLALGVGGYGLASLVPGPRSSRGNRSYLGLGYGGLVVRHNFVNQRLVYLSVGTLVGAGGVGFFEAVDEYEYEYEYDEAEFDADPFFVVEPSLGIHLNVTRWMRVGASVSYRLSEGIDCEGFTDRDFRGAAAGGHVQFGWF